MSRPEPRFGRVIVGDFHACLNLDGEVTPRPARPQTVISAAKPPRRGIFCKEGRMAGKIKSFLNS
jgi:hypothetical protein